MVKKVLQESGKRKTSIARATLYKEGSGLIKINKIPVEKLQPELARMRMKELLVILDRSRLQDVDIIIDSKGGGVISQMASAQIALCRIALKYLNDPHLFERVKNYDRTLIAGDSRQKESKKWGGPKARARFQKSFRKFLY